MLLLPGAVHVYVATAPCNLKKSFEGLTNEVRQVLAKDPLSGHVFVFLNRRKMQVKLLLWTRGGFTILPNGSSVAPSASRETLRLRRRTAAPALTPGHLRES